jgi:hypothetical protein
LALAGAVGAVRGGYIVSDISDDSALDREMETAHIGNPLLIAAIIFVMVIKPLS